MARSRTSNRCECHNEKNNAGRGPPYLHQGIRLCRLLVSKRLSRRQLTFTDPSVSTSTLRRSSTDSMGEK